MVHGPTDRDKDIAARLNHTVYKRHFAGGDWMSDLVDYHIGVYAAISELEGAQLVHRSLPTTSACLARPLGDRFSGWWKEVFCVARVIIF
jgi:hypothetical protein